MNNNTVETNPFKIATKTSDLLNRIETRFEVDGIILVENNAEDRMFLGYQWKLISFRQSHRNDWRGVELYRVEADGHETFLGYVTAPHASYGAALNAHRVERERTN